jgi:hypothetical protein
LQHMNDIGKSGVAMDEKPVAAGQNNVFRHLHVLMMATVYFHGKRA